MLMIERCENCPHRKPCKTASASRVGLVPLSKVQVELHAAGALTGDDVGLTRSEFQLYHRAVLRRPCPALDDKEVATILINSNELGVEPGQLILAALLAHRAGGADRPFYGRMLVGQSAIRHLNTYRNECATRYGTFDTALLGDVGQLPRGHNVTFRLRSSEELAAKWAMNAAMRRTRFDALYESRELALDPWWLATEPTYHEWLPEASTGSHELNRHRQRVRMAAKRAGMKAVLASRSRIAVDVALREATRFGLNHDHVLVSPVFKEPAKLWRAIASAAATVEALNILS